MMALPRSRLTDRLGPPPRLLEEGPSSHSRGEQRASDLAGRAAAIEGHEGPWELGTGSTIAGRKDPGSQSGPVGHERRDPAAGAIADERRGRQRTRSQTATCTSPSTLLPTTIPTPWWSGWSRTAPISWALTKTYSRPLQRSMGWMEMRCSENSWSLSQNVLKPIILLYRRTDQETHEQT